MGTGQWIVSGLLIFAVAYLILIYNNLVRPPGRSQHYILASSDPRTLARSYRISGWFAAIFLSAF